MECESIIYKCNDEPTKEKDECTNIDININIDIVSILESTRLSLCLTVHLSLVLLPTMLEGLEA